MMCKALAVEVLSGRPDFRPAWPAGADEAALAAWLRLNWAGILRESLSRSLTAAISSGIPLPITDAEQRDWITSRVDWDQIAARIQDELERHGHRRGRRALELATGEPYERIEAKLGDFVGTLEETFLRLSRKG
jgi:hypothetical protein